MKSLQIHKKQETKILTHPSKKNRNTCLASFVVVCCWVWWTKKTLKWKIYSWRESKKISVEMWILVTDMIVVLWAPRNENQRKTRIPAQKRSNCAKSKRHFFPTNFWVWIFFFCFCVFLIGFLHVDLSCVLLIDGFIYWALYFRGVLPFTTYTQFLSS